MTKSELIARISVRHPNLVMKDAELVVHTLFGAISKRLSLGARIELCEFGSFALNYRPPCKGRNPRSGESVMVPAKYMPHFKVGKELRARVDRGGRSKSVRSIAPSPCMAIPNLIRSLRCSRQWVYGLPSLHSVPQ